MKHLRNFLTDARRHKGLALIIVLSMLALSTIVMLAFLSVADSENKATNTHTASQTSRRLADTAVNIVMSQIQSGAEQDGALAGREIHATQPGAIRKYSQAGAFVAGYKLFSDQNMIFRPQGAGLTSAVSNTNESNFVSTSEPPSTWNSGNNLARYVDLNEPVIKGVVNAEGQSTATQIFFPVIDPRAAQNVDPSANNNIPVEGFSYNTQTAMQSNDISKVEQNKGAPIVLPGAGGDLNELRLAMPVQWLYVLKDGTIGHLDNALTFVTQDENATDASDTNPIVGRIAFWTDDESCKININTASEPTYMGQPIYYHERDQNWADYPAARGEYQRFPGHPATVALSSVLYPNPAQLTTRALDNYRIRGAELNRMLAVKNKIYQLMPRLNDGGSNAGTRFFEADSYSDSSDESSVVQLGAALNERLYASVDELLFSELGDQTTGLRVLNDASIGTTNLFTKETLERTSAFLTAHSRASEISMFGLPRIAMWPIDESVNKQTGFDKLIDFCSRVGSASNRYVFTRSKARDANYDVTLSRNTRLLSMMEGILGETFPSAVNPAGPGRSFRQKLGQDNMRQVIVSMFDYIRSTNLYDSFHVPLERNTWPTANISYNASGNANIYSIRDQAESAMKTYTPGVVRNSSNATNPYADRVLPGHGQVTPAEWRVGGRTYRGFGRSISVSEIGLQFICTADGQPDMYSWRIPKKSQNQPTEPNEPVRFEIPVVPEINVDLNGQSTKQADLNQLITLANSGVVSGGRTALKIDQTVQNRRVIDHYRPIGWTNNVTLTNVEAVHWRSTNSTFPQNTIKSRFYSNFPPLRQYINEGLYGTMASVDGGNESEDYWKLKDRHPGYDPANWNYTLDYDSPLPVNKKRVQALLHFEFFCPSVGYTEIMPDFTLVIRGRDVNNILVNNSSIFPAKDIVLRSERPLFEFDGTPEVGGYASFRKIAQGRRVRGDMGAMTEDDGYDTTTTGAIHSGQLNMDCVSNFFDVDSNAPINFTSENITIEIYDSHDYANRAPMQTIQFRLEDGRTPSPELVTFASYNVNYRRSDDSLYNHPAIQAPRWWSFHRDGSLWKRDANDGVTNPETDGRRNYRGRFYRFDTGADQVDNETLAVAQNTTIQRVPGARALIYGQDNVYSGVLNEDRRLRLENPTLGIAYHTSSVGGFTESGPYDIPANFGSDVVRSILPKYGDSRIIYLKKNVTANDWERHRFWNDDNIYLAHNFSSYHAGGEPGFDRGRAEGESLIIENNTNRILPPSVTASADRRPDAPATAETKASAQKYFDFDDSDPGGRVGPFIGKADEGNYSVGEVRLTGWPAAKKWRSSYFRSNNVSSQYAPGKGSFFTPNRMISSPVMMGSLPSVPLLSDGQGAWTNLLFRPHVQYSSGSAGGGVSMETTHPGQSTPPDHYLLDLFWMPVVEPYAISESLSTAGKVNMNYQILPFTHIRRATALHAVMKGELFSAMPNADYQRSKDVRSGWGPSGNIAPRMRNETAEGGDAAAFWHRKIVVDRFTGADGSSDSPWWQQSLADRVQGTLRQFEERFHFGNGPYANSGLPGTFRGGLFRSASQICEIHLIPSRVGVNYSGANLTASDVRGFEERNSKMGDFWGSHCSTGDNTRERPYANLYAKLTTRSNTFRVHVRSQTIRKALRSVSPNVFDPEKDLVIGEYRGSFLLERYIDQNDLATRGAAVDYAISNPLSLAPLDSYYRFRVLESKRFAP